MRFFCTYFDSRYLTRGLALHESLRRHAGHFRLFVLCMDAAAFDALSALHLPGLEPIALGTLEAHDPELLAVKSTRSTIEYYFTCTPALPLYLLQRQEVDLITYIDADLYFFNDPAPLFEELGDASVGMISHRFPPEIADLRKYGEYNVGFVPFRNDQRGLAVLESWRQQCLEWCYDQLEGDRFADQKYLDAWPARFDGVRVLQHRGANVAPWNVRQYPITEHSGTLFAAGQPLLFYHFHGLRRIGRSFWDLGLWTYKARLTPVLKERVYRPYLQALGRGGGSALRAGQRIRLTDLARIPLLLVRGELLVQR